MIKILIVDDSTEKISILRKFLIEECNIKNDAIDEAKTVKDARKVLYEENYDLMILDLVLPSDSESDAHADESIKFLKEISYNSDINIPAHIIGFSQYDEMIDSYGEEFDDLLWHLVHFSFKNSNWKDRLRSKICHLVSVRERFVQSITDRGNFDICIMCALASPELSAVLELPLEWKMFEVDNDPIIYYEGHIDTLNGNQYKVLACSINKMGMQAAASIATMVITKFKIRYLFMSGICAGIKERGLNLGDIVIAENLTDYGSGKMTENENGEFVLKPEPHQLPTDHRLISKIHPIISDKNEIAKIQNSYRGDAAQTILKAYIGPVASGSYVVASKGFLTSIEKQNRKLLGIDMEGYGVYLASHLMDKTKVLLVKSVCDFGDSQKGDDFQKYASYTSAKFLHTFIFNCL